MAWRCCRQSQVENKLHMINFWREGTLTVFFSFFFSCFFLTFLWYLWREGFSCEKQRMICGQRPVARILFSAELWLTRIKTCTFPLQLIMLRTTRATGSRSTCHAQIHPSKINGDGLQECVVIVFKKFWFRSSTRNQRNNVPEKLHSGILREIAVLTG